MRRAIARGRMLPQSLSTDPRYGRLSLKAVAIFPLMWANCDDQGRLSGDPDEIKYAVCPNIDHIKKEDIPELLKELEAQEFIRFYSTSKLKAVQMLDWWQEQKLQWAYPSRYPPPPDWTDHLRYHPTPKEIVTENWPLTGLPSELPSQPASALPSKLPESPLTTPSETEKENEKEGGRGKRRLPSALGSKPPTTTENELLQFLSTLKNWRFDKSDDLAWLREFRQEWADFDVARARACRDYHSGRSPPKHKGHWKNRFRQWMTHEQEFARERGETGESKGQRVKGARTATDFRGRKW